MAHPSFSGPPVHPGGLLREVLIPGAGMTAAEFAARLGVEPHELAAVLDERQPVAPALALRLGALLGAGGARHWLAMQAEHDLTLAAAEIGHELDRIVCIEPPLPEGVDEAG